MLRATFDCTEAVAASLDRLGTWAHAQRHDFLLHQGDRHHRCHIVLSGSADVKALGSEGQCVQIATVEPGEIFGAYPDPGPVRADVQAKSAMELVSLDTVQLSRLALAHAEAGAGLARIFARQLGNMLDRFAARVTLTATGRVYACLLARLGNDDTICPAPVVAALAVEAQTTRETASRAIGALERRGIVRREGDTWRVTSSRLLEELVI
ncbi:MAG TPA: Crp/Fnr family transcriptional regulator [Croceibacterium sp.]